MMSPRMASVRTWSSVLQLASSRISPQRTTVMTPLCAAWNTAFLPGRRANSSSRATPSDTCGTTLPAVARTALARMRSVRGLAQRVNRAGAHTPAANPNVNGIPAVPSYVRVCL
jgi:hypothetical protein